MNQVCLRVIFTWAFLLCFAEGVCDEKGEERDDIRIVVLGESFQMNDGAEGLNKKVLSQLFLSIKQNRPDAVFFTGNMILGVEPEKEKSKEIRKSRYRQIPPWMEDLVENSWPEHGHDFNKDVFLKQLQEFSSILSEKLGKEIPFYPIGGSHEAVSPESGKLFQQHFQLKTEMPNNLNAVGYSVVVEDAFFLLLPTSRYDQKEGGIGEFLFNDQYLKWINTTLREAALKYPYLFVIGNKPAYSTTATYGLYRGLERSANERNRFWRILKNNGVIAYFSGYEPLFDRSLREGVWQFISGGAGAPFSQKFAEQTFHHYLLLLIPKDRKGPAIIKVIDTEGRVRDEFELDSTRNPLYQFRISNF